MLSTGGQPSSVIPHGEPTARPAHPSINLHAFDLQVPIERTPLHDAATAGDDRLVEQILKSGADRNKKESKVR